MRFKEAKKLNKGLSNKVEALENDYAKLILKYERLFGMAQVLAECSDFCSSFRKEVKRYNLDPKNFNEEKQNGKDNG